METFVKNGDRVTVYKDVYSMKRKEGAGTVVAVHRQSDLVSAYVDVLFDDGDDRGPYPRWVLPQHVDNKEG